MDLVAYFKIIVDFYAFGAQAGYLVDEGLRVDDHTVADNADLPFMQYARGDKMQDKLLVADDDGMSGVIAALIPHDVIGVAREYVYYLTLALISPLGSYNDCVCHIIVL